MLGVLGGMLLGGPPLAFLGGLFPQEHAPGAEPSMPCSWVARPQHPQGDCPQALALPVTTKDDVAGVALVLRDGHAWVRMWKVCSGYFSLVHQLWGCLPSP